MKKYCLPALILVSVITKNCVAESFEPFDDELLNFQTSGGKTSEEETPPVGTPQRSVVFIQDNTLLSEEAMRPILAQASALVQARRYQEARDQIEWLRAQPIPHLEVLFISAIIYFESGDYLSAIQELRSMLVRDASLIRPRLELARALFMAHDYAAARYHFEQVLASDIPDSVRKSILSFLLAIREKVPSYIVGLDLVTDTNPRQSTSSKAVNIGGRLYRLNDTMPSRSTLGVMLTASGQMPVESDPSWYLRGSTEMSNFPNSYSDLAYVQVAVGKRVSFSDTHSLSLELGGHHSQFQTQKLYDGAIVRMANFVQERQATWQVALEGRQLSYPVFTYLSGRQLLLPFDYSYAIDAANRIQGGLVYVDNRALEKSYSFNSPSAFVRISHEWDGGINAGLKIQYTQSTYQGADPFFGLVRADRESRGEVDLVNRNWQIGMLSPKMVIGLVEHHSNVNLYSFRRGYFRLGMTREF